MSNSDAEGARGTDAARAWVVGGADVACGSIPSSAISCAALLFGSGVELYRELMIVLVREFSDLTLGTAHGDFIERVVRILRKARFGDGPS